MIIEQFWQIIWCWRFLQYIKNTQNILMKWWMKDTEKMHMGVELWASNRAAIKVDTGERAVFCELGIYISEESTQGEPWLCSLFRGGVVYLFNWGEKKERLLASAYAATKLRAFLCLCWRLKFWVPCLVKIICESNSNIFLTLFSYLNIIHKLIEIEMRHISSLRTLILYMLINFLVKIKFFCCCWLRLSEFEIGISHTLW